jgi:hypothetical protein
MQRVAIKYCGGCNPDYDRVGLVKRIKQSLDGRVEFVSLEDENIDLLLAIEGCPTACAELRSIKATEILIINKVDDAMGLLQNILT